MSFIFLGVGNDGQDMWGTLKPPTVNYVVDIVDERIVCSGSRPGLPPAHVEGSRYAGNFPSMSVCEFLNGIRQKMKFFDDGERLTYKKAGQHKLTIVEVEPSKVEHPIAYPPAGFVLQDDHWVRATSKYL